MEVDVAHAGGLVAQPRLVEVVDFSAGYEWFLVLLKPPGRIDKHGIDVFGLEIGIRL